MRATHLIPRPYQIPQRRDDRQSRTHSRFVEQQPASCPRCRHDTRIRIQITRDPLLVRRYDVDTIVEETGVRLRDGIGRRVVHEDDPPGVVLDKEGQRVVDAIDARCRRGVILECGFYLRG